MANTTDSIINCLERNWTMIEAALAGMDDEVLNRAPANECNSAAWILWHMTRVLDMFIHFRLQDAEQMWTKDGWAEKFKVEKGIEDRGVGWTAEHEWQHGLRLPARCRRDTTSPSKQQLRRTWPTSRRRNWAGRSFCRRCLSREALRPASGR